MASESTNSPFSTAQFSSNSGPSTLSAPDKFKMPSEPRPLASFDSDEESFVVLGKSLSPEEEMASEEIDQPIGTDVVEEAKKLISKELRAVEQMSLKSKHVANGENRENAPPNMMTNSYVSVKTEKVDGPATDFPEMPPVNKGFETTNTISITTFSNDLNSAEVQAKITEIMEENIHLKDTILQNNMSMKAQYERIVAWQEDVQRVHQQHKEKILEAKDIIEKLKKENSNLTHEKDRFKQIIDMQNEELSILKKELKDKGEQPKETVILNGTEDQEKLQVVINKQNEELAALRTQLNDRESEKEESVKVKQNMDELQQIIEKQKQEIDFLKKQLQDTEKLVNEKLAESTENLKEVIEAQKQELAALKIIVKDRERFVDEKLTKSSDNNLKEFELDVANKKIKELEISLQNLTSDNCTMKENMKDCSEKKEKELQETIQKLKMVEHELEALKTSSADKEQTQIKTIEDLKLQIGVLKQHYANMPSPEELHNIKTQLTNTQVTLTQVEQSRTTAYSQISSLNQEIQELNMKIEEKQSQEGASLKDEFFALQTQLEVYKTDFEQERTAKNNIKEEKEKLEQDLQNLHRRNQQLQEEIEIIRENRDFHVYPPRTRTSSNNTPSAPQDSPMKCPKCDFRLHTLQALENHVYRCIELDDNLP